MLAADLRGRVARNSKRSRVGLRARRTSRRGGLCSSLAPSGYLHAFGPVLSWTAPPGSFVAARHDVALTPAAWMLETSPAQQTLHAHRSLLLVADPVYQADDPRRAVVKSALATSQPPARRSRDPARSEFRRLPFTAQEAVGISAQFPPTEVDQLIGLDATRDRLLARDWSAYRFIHIATHRDSSSTVQCALLFSRCRH
jgi:CHAT domain-containing protein